jgi:hypothetical protein
MTNVTDKGPPLDPNEAIDLVEAQRIFREDHGFLRAISVIAGYINRGVLPLKKDERAGRTERWKLYGKAKGKKGGLHEGETSKPCIDWFVQHAPLRVTTPDAELRKRQQEEAHKPEPAIAPLGDTPPAKIRQPAKFTPAPVPEDAVEAIKADGAEAAQRQRSVDERIGRIIREELFIEVGPRHAGGEGHAAWTLYHTDCNGHLTRLMERVGEQVLVHAPRAMAQLLTRTVNTSEYRCGTATLQ